MLSFRLLEPSDLPDLHAVYNIAFAAHAVTTPLDAEQFEQKMQNDGVDLAYSVGAFDQRRLVAFIMHAPGFWNQHFTVYNAATGVHPDYRGQRLTRRMYEFLQPALQITDVRQCLLEVARENEPAWESYQQVGFRISRSFHCYQTALPATWDVADLDVYVQPAPILAAELRTQAAWLDRQPSWQNSLDAILRSPRDKLHFQAWREDTCVGYLIAQKATGHILQFGVHPDHRRRGVARALFARIARTAYAPRLTVLNIDRDRTGIHNFLVDLGFAPLYAQHELLLTLD
ncbi:MAG: GNAT family N-acetyltransferase [Catalinimonas sp.]